VAVSGVCLTVVGEPALGSDLIFDLSAETLERSWFGDLAPGRPVNLERSLRMGDRLGGHMVSGHVDGMGSIEAVEDSGDGGRLFRFRVPSELERYLIEKGSVTLDGISLTVVEPAGGHFAVAVIPETLEVTSLGSAVPGQRVNVEADLVGKWIEKLLPPR
jgi:riboflavin synthase